MTHSEAWARVQEIDRIARPSDQEEAELHSLLDALAESMPESAAQIQQWRDLRAFARGLRKKQIEYQGRPLARFWFMTQVNFAICLYQLGRFLSRIGQSQERQ
jgi:hypothetical protein